MLRRTMTQERRDLRQASVVDEPLIVAPAAPGDQELIVRVREARDREAMAALYDGYARLVYALALSILREPRAAEDITQEVFVTFWQRPEAYVAARGPFGPWILRVTRNRAIDVLRRRGREQQVDEEREPLLSERLVDGEPAPDEQVAERMIGRELRAAIAELTEAQRQVIELAYFRGLSQSEMAVRLDVPLGTVKARVRAALRRLAQVTALEYWNESS